jgi:hypothetical protein
VPYTQSGLPFVSHDASRDAALRAESFSGRQLRTYLAFVVAKGSHGATDREAEEQIPMRRSSVCARRNELLREELIIDTGLRRCGCAVWRAVECR